VATLTKLESKPAELCNRAMPIRQRHLREVLDGSLKLAAGADPGQEAS
jgi:hypothetical protein